MGQTVSGTACAAQPETQACLGFGDFVEHTRGAPGVSDGGAPTQRQEGNSLTQATQTSHAAVAFRRHPRARLFVDGTPVAPAAAPSAGTVLPIAAQPVAGSAALVQAAMQAGAEFCVHGGATPPAAASPGGYLQCETSGSTGQPKRIRRSHASWLRSFEIDRDLWRLGTGDRIAVLGPLNQSLALYGVAEAIHLGLDADIIAAPRPDARRRLLRQSGPTIVFATPAQLRQLAIGGAATGTVRHLLVGGGFLDAAARDAAARVFPGAALHGFYGASETSFITLAADDAPPGSVGQPYPGVTVEIRDAGGGPVPPGICGELWVQSPYLFDAYAAGESPETRWQGGFLTVGELGWRDAGGNLFLAGRRNRMFTVSDRNVYPEAIEQVLQRLPGVAQAAVLPVPDARRGSVPVCFLAPGPAGLDADLVLVACRQIVGAEIAPRRAILLCDWPALPSGKTDIPALQRLLAEGA